MRSNILLILCFAGHVAFAAPAPFKSKEEVDFLSKKNNELVSLVKTDDFQGLVTRPYEKNSDLQNAEYYQFKSVDQSKVSQKLCEVWLERIFGPLKEITLKVQYTGMAKSPSGAEACEATVTDPKDPKSKIPERRIILGFLKDQPSALVFKLSKKSDAAVQDNIRAFWQGLR